MWSMPFGATEDGILIQGPKSKDAKFPASICAKCNNAVTSEHDIAYSKFSDRLAQLMDDEVHPECISHEKPWVDPSSEETKNLFRYFAKMLGCHAAAIEAPIPNKFSEFICGADYASLFGCQILLKPDAYNIIKAEREKGEPLSYVAHHGLAFMLSKSTLELTGLQSSISLNWTQINYSYQFNFLEVADLESHFPGIATTARAGIQKQ